MQGPTLAEIRNARQDLEGLVVETPVWRWRSDALDAAVGAGTQVLLKLELELCAQAQDLDAVVIPIGGGGLCAGVAAAVKQISPRTLVFGVEPEGADTMHRSFASGKPEGIDKVRTIADSLGAPHAAPYSFGLCRTYVDDLAKVS